MRRTLVPLVLLFVLAVPATASAEREYYGMLFNNSFEWGVLACAANGTAAGDRRWRVQVEFQHHAGKAHVAHVEVVNAKGNTVSHQKRRITFDDRKVIYTSTKVRTKQKVFIYATRKRSSDILAEFHPVHPSRFARC